MYVSTVTTVSIQMIFCSHVTKRRTELFCIPIKYSTCSFSWFMLQIKATFNISSAVSTTCSNQLPDVVFLLPTLRYWSFRLWYKWICLPNFASASCVKQIWLLSQEKLFQTTMQSTLLTLKRLIQLPTCVFWHTPRTLLSMDTFKSPFRNGLFKQ